MSRRTERLASVIQREIAEMILRELNDPRLSGMPSVTRVAVSPDLSVADVYISVMGSEGHQKAALSALQGSAGMIRSRLTKSLNLRISPIVKFHLDEMLKKELEMMELLRKIELENAELDRRRGEAK